MFLLDVETSFAAGHALRGYLGKCENWHGHNYKVQLTIAGESLNEIGLLCDFKDVKALIKETIAGLIINSSMNLNRFEKPIHLPKTLPLSLPGNWLSGFAIE